MPGTPSQGSQTQLAIDSSAIVGGTPPGFEFLSFGLKRQDTQTDSQGIRGTRSRLSQRTRITQRACSGAIVMNPTPTELDLLWPWILGGSTSGGVTGVGETLSDRYIGIKRVRKMATFSECKVASFVLSGQQGQPIQTTLNVEAQDETEANVASWPSITYPTDNMFVFSDLALTIDSTTHYFSQLTLTIDNVLQADRYLNSLTRDKITPQDRAVTIDLGLPYDDVSDVLYGLDPDGVAASLVMSDGTTTYTFAFGNVKAAAVGPEIAGKSEILLPLQLRCFYDGTDREIKVTKS